MTPRDLADLVFFLDDPETQCEAGLVHGLARVETLLGACMVAGTRHLEVPHLAVTSVVEGTFDVTHLPTGTTVLRAFDSLGAALLALAQLHAIRVHYRLDFDRRATVEVIEQFTEVDGFPVPFTHGTTAPRPSVGMWRGSASELAGEWRLPWESSQQLTREAIELIAATQSPSTSEVRRAG